MKSWPNFGARGKRKGSINYINQKNKNTKHIRKIIMKSWPNLTVGGGKRENIAWFYIRLLLLIVGGNFRTILLPRKDGNPK